MILIYIFTLFFLLYTIYLLTYSLIKGAPFAPLGRKRLEAMLELLEIKRGKNLADLGSGDRRIAAPHIMGSIEKKLTKELRPGTKVVPNHCKFPNLKAVRQLNDVYCMYSRRSG